VRGQFAVRTTLPHPARHHRVVDRVPRHGTDQNPQRHLIRPHHHTLAHDRQTVPATRPATITPRRTDQEQAGQSLDPLRLRGIGPRPGRGVSLVATTLFRTCGFGIRPDRYHAEDGGVTWSRKFSLSAVAYMRRRAYGSRSVQRHRARHSCFEGCARSTRVGFIRWPGCRRMLLPGADQRTLIRAAPPAHTAQRSARRPNLGRVRRDGT
jgi:hypothetical protein